MIKPGTIFGGRFKILEELGRGGMGAVYRAEQVALRREVALKLMHPYLAQAPGAAERFHREARVLAKLKHPRSVEVYDLGEADGTLFIAMEILHGVGLDEVLHAGGPMQAERAVSVAAQVLEALEAAHSLGVVHRDLKPGNIFLLAPGAKDPGPVDNVKVLDFGLAFLREESGAGRITRQGQTAGTPAYMAPEQCRGEEVDGRSDIYAFGCTLYEMLTGTPPFGYGEENAMETMAAHLYRPPQRPSVIRWDLGVPPLLEEVLMRALAKLPRDRFRSAEEMRQALFLSLDEQPIEDARGTGKKVARPPQTAPAVAVPGADKLIGVAGSGANAESLFSALGAAGMSTREVPASNDLSGFSLVIVAPPPGGAALDAAAKFAAQPNSPPVLLCGAEDDLGQMAKAIGASVFDYVPLPLDAADLSRKVSRALRRRR